MYRNIYIPTVIVRFIVNYKEKGLTDKNNFVGLNAFDEGKVKAMTS